MWRFVKSPLKLSTTSPKLRVVCAGEHFPAGYHYTQQVLKERHLQDKIEVLRTPTWQELMDIAPTVHVAIPFMERFTSEFIQKATNLYLIQQYGVGVEGIDLSAATECGVAVANVPAHGTANARATAEHALLLTLMLLRSTHDALPTRFQNQVLGGWPLPQTLYQQRVTVVGYGAVGSQLCQYLITLGANVTAVRRHWPNDNNENKNDLSKLIKQSTNLNAELPTTDVLILCCTMTPETHHLINQHRISLLPSSGTWIVNVGRGPLVEYDAICQGLDDANVLGYASDVGIGHSNKPSEPWDPNDPLSFHPKTIFTPHVGGNCDLVVKQMADTIVTNLERILAGKPPHHWVNHQ